MKRCSKCGFECEIEVAGEHFNKNRRTKSGYRTECKTCRKSYYAANRDTISEYNKQWYAANREARAEYNKQWREANPEYAKQYCKNNREARAEYNKQWQKDNRDKEIAKYHRRRARKASSGESFTADDIANLYEQQLATCAYCHCDISDGYEIDHIQPISKGGSSNPYNLALACRPCNRSKNAKTLFEFLNTMTDITIPEAQSYEFRT